MLALTEFSAASRRDGNRAIVWFEGELDCAAEGLARAEIEIALERGGTELVIDLRDVSFLDARGVHVLLHARDACRAQDRQMAVIPAPDHVQHVIELCNLEFAPAEPLGLAA